MLDDNEISKRFGYKNSSNLVIPTNQRNREYVPNGEAESLVGRIKYKMGDLANRQTKPKKEKKQIKKKKGKNIFNEDEVSNILEIDIRKNENKYIPTTIETKVAYDELLGILTDIIGSQPGNILNDIAFELLLILNNEEINDEDKRDRCKEILMNINNEEYSRIIEKSRILTDFNSNIEKENFKENEETSEVAVIFDESETENEDEYNSELDDDVNLDSDNEEEYINEINEIDEDNNEINNSNDYIHISGNITDEKDILNDPDIIEINKMDAYWLQRELYSIFNDAEKSLKLENEIIPILCLEDDQECENSLVILFNYEHFSWIKKLLKNRWNIYYCTIIGQASSDLEKKKIIDEMKDHPQGSIVLDLMSKPILSKNNNSNFLKSIEKYIENNNINNIEDQSNTNITFFNKKSRGKILDLDQIYSEQNINFNLNTKVILPEGSERIEKADYDLISIPPISKSNIKKIKLISIEELPEWCKECFYCVSIKTLNEIQSTVFETAFKEFDENLLVCAPTGSGKTNIAILCILNILSQYISNSNNNNFNLNISKFKIVYISPTKALVAEQVESLRIRLKPLGIKVNEMTGDTRISRSLMELTQVFVTTPEKFDVITRKSNDGLSDKLKLIIFDEIHMLHDSRGAIIEAIVARFKDNYIRLVGLSATLPNYIDIAEFLNVNPNKGMYYFGPEYRPVPLLQTFIGIKAKKGFKKIQLINDLVYEKVIHDISKHQILVFVHSRKDTLQTAKYIRDKAMEKGNLNDFFPGNNIISREILLDEINNIKSNNLKEILPSGIGIHHSGLIRSDRKLIEDLFSDGHIRVLISTATLAWGVNLPAHTVIIKGTQIYQPEKSEWTELSPLDMLQMIGRGGRPQYDNNGHGIIITDFDHLTYYLSLLNQQLNIESQLIQKLPDLINAEISLGNILSKNDIFNWFIKTFLYIRINKNPKLYGLDIDHIINNQIENIMTDQKISQNDTKLLIKQEIQNYSFKLIDSAIDKLEKCNLIQYDHKNQKILSLLLGQISSHFYLSPETIQDINKQLLPNLSEIQLFRLFSTCKEFKYIIVRNEEKIELEKLVDKVPIPIQGIGAITINNGDNIANIADIDTYTKVNVLLQLYLTGSRWINAKLTLLSDLHYIVQSAPRIFRAIFYLSLKRRWSNLAKKTLKIATMIERRLWEAMSPLRQFKGISDEVIKRIEKKDIQWEKYYDFTSNQLGELLKSPKLGPILYNLIRKLPKVNISGTMFPIDSEILQIDLIIKPNFIWDNKIHGQSLSGDINTENINTGETFWIIIEDCDGNYLYFSDMIIIRPSNQLINNETIIDDEYYLTCQIFLNKKNQDGYIQNNILPPLIFVRAIADRWLHSETCIPISLEKIILPKKIQENTELLDLKLINISKIFIQDNLNYYLEKMFNYQIINDNIKLNSIQTQLFNLIYNSEKSLFLSCPPCNGQFICTCIGIIREIKLDPEFKKKNFQILFLSCNNEKIEYLKSKFINIFGNDIVGCLCGNNFEDNEILEFKSIIISNIENWDKISKKLSKIKQLFKKLKLLIIDNIEFIYNNNNGFFIESVISRLRYTITPLNLKIRIFGYCKSISNSFEISEWLGISKENTFSFDQNIFNEKINKKVIGFDSYYRSTRINMMIKYIKDNILKLELNNGFKNKILIFVLEYEYCLNISNEFSLFISENIKIESNFELNQDFIKFKNNILKFSLLNRIGFLYKNQSIKEKEYIISEYNKGNLNIMIVCEDMCNLINLKFDKVIIIDTKKIDYEDNKGSLINKKTRKTIDYNQLDIYEMLSKCNNNKYSDFILLCSSNKKDFYEYILNNSLPLESNIDIGIIDCINTEIALRTIKTKQDIIDWITWTLFYRRIFKNPSYYGLTGNTSKHISDYLSEYIEEILDSLSNAKCIEIKENNEIIENNYNNKENLKDRDEGDDNIIPLNLCLISAFYNIRISSIEFISKNIYENDNYSSLLYLISSIPFLKESCIIRKGDLIYLTQIKKELNLKLEFNMDENIINNKIQLLLISYLKRYNFIKRSSLKNDLLNILKIIINLLYAMVDIASSFGWIRTSIKIMELSQMFVQGIENPINKKLLQIPYINNNEQIELLNKYNINDVYDLINMEDNIREDILINKLNLNQEEINEIAKFCNNFPIIEVEYNIIGCKDIDINKKRRLDNEELELENNINKRLFKCENNIELILIININRDLNEEELLKKSIIIKELRYYPFEKEEQWWIILIENNLEINNINIDKEINKEEKILCIKRIQLNKINNEIKLRFNSNKDFNKITDYKLLIISDSYIGCDQEFLFSIST